LVFDIEWDFTKSRILDEDFISEEGTFIEPVRGEFFTGRKGDNWGNRSSLLATYREFKAFAISEGLYDPDDSPWSQ